jgi:hypothetical protein
MLTYDNGILPHALFEAGRILSNPRYTEVAQQTCDFLIGKTFNGKHFSLIGCNGWYERGRMRASFDQQPIDAASLVMMLRAAYHASEDVHYLLLQRKAFDWFLGANDINTPLYNFRTTGCYDGLIPGGVNINQGAESTLSFLLSLLEVIDSYALLDKYRNNESIAPKISSNILDIPHKSSASLDPAKEVR